MNKPIIYKQKQGYFSTIFEHRSDAFTVYYINRLADMTYEAICRMSGCGTDRLSSGSLGKCYKALYK